MAQAKGDAALARTLRLALAGMDGGGRLATEVEKRLPTIGRSRGFIEWDKVRPLAREFDSLRETIAGPLAATDPRAAVAQMRLLLGLADNVFERSDDGSGMLGEVFRQAGAELGRLWALLPHHDPVALAGEVLALWDADGYGTTDRLLEAAGPALGPEGRAEVRRLLEARLAALPRSRKPDAFEIWHGRGQLAFRLRDLADLESDVDAYIAATEAGGRAKNFAGDIAERLIAHGRPAEALAWLDRAPDRHESEGVPHADLRIAALDALGGREEAQALRWEAFRRWLTPQHLRPHLRGLPDFGDVDAEDRAIAYALTHPDRNLALSFLGGWPNLEAANRLLRAHHGEMDGRDYGRLRPAAEALAERYPVAATLAAPAPGRRRAAAGLLATVRVRGARRPGLCEPRIAAALGAPALRTMTCSWRASGASTAASPDSGLCWKGGSDGDQSRWFTRSHAAGPASSSSPLTSRSIRAATSAASMARCILWS
jgi:hypothetical protein